MILEDKEGKNVCSPSYGGILEDSLSSRYAGMCCMYPVSEENDRQMTRGRIFLHSLGKLESRVWVLPCMSLLRTLD